MFLAAFTIAASFASAPVSVGLDCRVQDNDLMQITLTAKRVSVTAPNVGILQQMEVEATGAFDNLLHHGRARNLRADRHYRPRRYVGHTRFPLHQVVDVGTGERFAPADNCALDVLVPNDIASRTEAVLPVALKCDHTGATLKLDCVVKPVP